MKKIVFIGTGLLIVLIVVLLFFTRGSEESKQSVSVETPKPTIITEPGINIINYSKFSARIPLQDKTSIESLLYANIPEINRSNKQNYQASINEESFSSLSGNDSTTTTFLVDIPALKVTYKLIFGSNSSDGENSVNIACAEAGETTYSTSICKAEELSR